MKFYMYFRCLVTLLVIVSFVTILLVNISNRQFLNSKTYQVDVKRIQAKCPQQTTSDEATRRPSTRDEMHDICVCPRAERSLSVQVRDGEGIVMSACDAQATARGFNQTVVSYSFYGKVFSDYFLGIQRNALKVKQMYPGYVMRVYHNLQVVGDNVISKALCDLWCDNDHLDFCNVQRLPYGLCNQNHVYGRIWRFFVLGDTLVDRFLIRDIDSDIMQREVDAVQEWIGERKTWHVMRDHPYHSNVILAGMWGGTNRNRTMTTALRNSFIEYRNKDINAGLDQHLLKVILWPIIQNDMVSHDSYTCQHFIGARPWPTRRETKEFVGNKFPWKKSKLFTINSKCPVECRPKEHQDWAYC